MVRYTGTLPNPARLGLQAAPRTQRAIELTREAPNPCARLPTSPGAPHLHPSPSCSRGSGGCSVTHRGPRASGSWSAPPLCAQFPIWASSGWDSQGGCPRMGPSRRGQAQRTKSAHPKETVAQCPGLPQEHSGLLFPANPSGGDPRGSQHLCSADPPQSRKKPQPGEGLTAQGHTASESG